MLYYLRKQQQLDKDYIQKPQRFVFVRATHPVNILMEKLEKAVIQTGIKEIVIGGGVSANSGLRKLYQTEIGMCLFHHCHSQQITLQ